MMLEPFLWSGHRRPVLRKGPEFPLCNLGFRAAWLVMNLPSLRDMLESKKNNLKDPESANSRVFGLMKPTFDFFF